MIHVYKGSNNVLVAILSTPRFLCTFFISHRGTEITDYVVHNITLCHPPLFTIAWHAERFLDIFNTDGLVAPDFIGSVRLETGPTFRTTFKHFVLKLAAVFSFFLCVLCVIVLLLLFLYVFVCSGLSARGIPLTERSLQQLLENWLLSVGYWILGCGQSSR